jgi:hypothetical protein
VANRFDICTRASLAGDSSRILSWRSFRLCGNEHQYHALRETSATQAEIEIIGERGREMANYKLTITTPTAVDVPEPFDVQFSIDDGTGTGKGVPDPDNTHGQAIVTGYKLPDGTDAPPRLSLPELVGAKGLFCTIKGFAPGAGDGLWLTVRLIEIPGDQQTPDKQKIRIAHPRPSKGKERLESWKRGDYGGGVITITAPSPGSAVAAPFSATGTLSGTSNYNISGLLTTALGGQYGPTSINPGPNWSMTFNNPPGDLKNATLKVWYVDDATIFAQETFGGSDWGGKGM